MPARGYRRAVLATTGVLIGLLAVPAAGNAATTFGSPLGNAPNVGHCNTPKAPCTSASFMHPGAVPVTGVITKFRIRATKPDAGPGSVTLRLANIFQASRDAVVGRLVGGAGPTVNVAGTGEIEEFAARLPVWTGTHLALETSNANPVHSVKGSRSAYVFSPALRASNGLRASIETGGELLFQATVEPDADEDGFGDQTQDRAQPRLAALQIERGRAAFRLSEAARVRLRLERRDHHGRLHKVKRLRMDGRRGPNTIRFPRMGPGRYRLVLVATDQTGNRSKALAKRFRAD